ncbi:MAG: transcription factor S [Aigarchaeota archaeon]|nr:transcription factor S [Aigarchaeota archaeon]MCX8203093.1 transcription factor S [Nitrososphaeria archaeon]MDW8043415.1 transcription factor S [Nitrososphaerota archaeon]
MEFCPNCGSFMTTARTSGGVALVCRRCGYRKAGRTVEIKLRTSNRPTGRQRVGIVVEEAGEESSVHPKTTDVVCPECGNREAYWWTVQTRSADEPMTQFFRCTKCGHTWREYA